MTTGPPAATSAAGGGAGPPQPADQLARDRIRDDHAETLFVEAGAGTGKTTTLVARVVQMVANGHLVTVDGLAAITFTENAAAELRSRIREGLEQASRGGHRGRPYDGDQRERCRRALDSLDDAAVTTLHGFASRILADAPIEAGLPPGFVVADTIGAVVAGDEAWRAFIEDLLDDEDLRGHLLAGLTLDLKLTALREVATALSASWDRLVDRPLSRRELPPIDATPVLDALGAALRDGTRWPAGDRLTDHLRGPVTALATELGSLDHPLDLLEALGRDRARIATKAGQKDLWQRAGLQKAAVVEALRRAEQARDAIVATVGAAVTETLAARVQDWVLAEAARRRRDGSLEFHDLLVMCRDLLRTEPGVRHRLHERWPVLLIDEFQDTDPLQVEIVHLLACPAGPGDPPRRWVQMSAPPGRLFFVGDPKQSIYRFRRADVQTYREVGARHPAGLTRLDVNFRSVPGVLAAANHTFRALFAAQPDSGIQHVDLVAARLAADRPECSGAGDAAVPGPPVLLLGGACPDDDTAALRAREAAHIADVVVRAKHEAWRMECEQTRPDGTSERARRPVSFQDIAILLPTRTALPALERALQARDVPYRVESRSLVWSTDAVRDLVTLLQAIDNPADSVALLAALRHPGLACSDLDLVTWRAAQGRWSYLSDPPPGVEDHPVAAAFRILRSWHERRWWVEPNVLVEAVVRELRLVELTTAQRRPRDHWRRLRFLVDRCRAWCDAGGSGLGAFVDWAAGQIDSDADVLETVVPETDDDAVRILTVHGAKGLEFPVTIVAGLGGSAGGQPRVLWTATGPQVRLKADKLEMPGWDAATAAERTAAAHEATRLLYVALTRAMDHLVLGCYHRPAGSEQASHAQTLSRLLSGSALARVEPALPASTAHRPVDVPAATGPPTGTAFRETQLRRRADLLAAVSARVATSPTALAAAAAAQTDQHPAAMSPRRASRHGAAIGTAVHRVLELVDLAQPSEAEVRRLAELACAEQDLPALAGDVAGRAWSALRSDVVRACGKDPHAASREVYLVVKDGERFVEGYLDLLAPNDAGGWTIIDYKTDRVLTPADHAARQAHYAPQLRAYVGALESVLVGAPIDARLVFAPPAAP